MTIGIEETFASSDEALGKEERGTGRAESKSRKTGGTESVKPSDKILRISFLVPRAAIPRLEWMMQVSRTPSKVDLLRDALNHYEDHLIKQEAERREMRKQAGAPELEKVSS